MKYLEDKTPLLEDGFPMGKKLEDFLHTVDGRDGYTAREGGSYSRSSIF